VVKSLSTKITTERGLLEAVKARIKKYAKNIRKISLEIFCSFGGNLYLYTMRDKQTTLSKDVKQ